MAGMFGRGRTQSTGSREQRAVKVERIVGGIRRPKTTEAVGRFLTDFRKSSERPEDS